MSHDPFGGMSPNAIQSYPNASAVTPHDVTGFLVPARALWIGGAGNVAYMPRNHADGSAAIVLVGVPAGTVLMVWARQVFSTGTTATNIVALW